MNSDKTDDIPSQDFGPKLDIAARSIISPKQDTLPENQDNYLLIDCNGLARYLQNHTDHFQQIEGWTQGHIRVAIIDGIGGHGNGRQVAEATAENIAAIPPCFDQQQLNSQLEALHDTLQKQFHNDGKIPGCTLTLLEIPADGPAMLFHVGDSRLYQVTDRSQFLTIDHVPASQFAINRQMEQAEWFKQVHEETRCYISQAFVMGNNLEDGSDLQNTLFELKKAQLPEFLCEKADRREIDLQGDGLYLLGTDGLWAQSEPQTFIQTWPELLNKPNKALPPLVDDLFVELIINCKEDQHLDNATAVVLRLKETS